MPHHNEGDRSNRVKTNQFFLFLLKLSYNQVDFTCFLKCLIFFKVLLMASLNILCLDPHNLLKEVIKKNKKLNKKKLNRKKAHKIFFCGPSKLLKNIS